MSAEQASRIARIAERTRRSQRRALQIGIPTAAPLGAGAAVAIGSIPGTDGAITGCYSTNQSAGAALPYGTLRVIDPSLQSPTGGPSTVNSCSPSEHTLTWNQQGPPGPQGAPGAQGAAGTPGAQGSQGASGASGQTQFQLAGSGQGFFLKLEGITGESTQKAHKGDIEISSFSWGATNPSNGSGAGRASIQSFSITKHQDKSSASLLKFAADGSVLKFADILVAHRRGAALTDVADYRFSQVVVTSIQLSGAGSAQTSEKVTFHFGKVQESFGQGTNKVTIGLTLKLAQ